MDDAPGPLAAPLPPVLPVESPLLVVPVPPLTTIPQPPPAPARVRVLIKPEWHYAPAGRDIVVIDTETTGLTAEDRVVSFGAVVLTRDELRPVQVVSLVFNPGRPSHPMARKVHGLADEFLAKQPPFSEHAAEIKSLLKGRVVAAHNLAFDLRMLDQDFSAAGFPRYGGTAGRYCTMQEWRWRFPGTSAKLANALAALGLPKQPDVHGAVEDAALAAMLLQALHGYERIIHPPVVGLRFQNAH